MFSPKIHFVDSSNKIYFDDAKRKIPKVELKGGEIIFGDINKDFKVIKIPIITKILEKRNEICRKLFIQSAGKTTILQAALFGNRDYLSNEIKDIFIITGTYHLLAISGLHVGLIASLIYFLFSFLPVKFRYLMVSFFLLIFIILTGFKVTVIRASLFAIIILTALFLDIKTNILKLTIFLCAFFILLSPNILYDLSFILSFSAVLGIILVAERYKRFLFILIPLAATAFTMPTILYSYGNFNYLGVVNTFIMLPFIYFLLILGFFLPIGVEKIIAPITLVEEAIHSVGNFLYQISYNFFVLNKIDIFVLLILVLLIFLFFVYRKIWFVLLIFLIPFINYSPRDIVIFPNMIRSKGFIDLREPSQIYFKGFYNDFKYKFLLIVAKYNKKIFEKGSIYIYDGKNYYLKYRDFKIDNICINNENSDCEIVYMTRSNSIKKFDNNKWYITYKNRKKSDNIIELYNKKCVTFLQKGISYDKSFCQ
ncbi:ComEC/Rec2 family competence protein [Deferribacter thermophilus]|uniref:ComEC/Rec2 family competence protein n=1 Tax=Deferribacter thermophilus TaxID=53573 RepID=UPI003C1F677C